MRKTIWIFALLAMLVYLSGCDLAVNITQPIIIIQSSETSVFDTISISVTENADIDGERVVPDYYEWKILDFSENVIASDFPETKNIIWVPDNTGNFLISVKIGYNGNKSITTLREITITESPTSLQRRLVGHWIGTAEAMFGVSWDVDITFTETGHVIATASNISDAEYIASPFYFGSKTVTSPTGGQMHVSPSADIPCQMFTLNEVINNTGFGVLYVGYESALDGSPYFYDCNNNFEIQHLIFSNNENSVYFSLIDYGSDSYEWYLRYNLERVN